MNTLITIAAVMNLSVCGGVKTGRLRGLDGGLYDTLYEIDLDSDESTLLHAFDEDIAGGSLTVGSSGTLYSALSGAALVIIDPDTGDLTFLV